MNELTVWDRIGAGCCILLGMAVIVELLFDKVGFEWVHVVLSLVLIVGGAFWLRPRRVEEAIKAAEPLIDRD